MTARSILLFTIAILMAGGTAFYARSLILAERQSSLQAVENDAVIIQQQDTKMVLVAGKGMQTGGFVGPDSLEWLSWPEDGISDSYISASPEDLEDPEVDIELREAYHGAVARQNILPGQPISREQFIFPGERGFLAAVLQKGNRAVSVPINETTGIAGFVFPGDRVDLILSLRLKGEDEEGDSNTRYASLTLAEDVRVLAVDQAVTNEEGEPIIAKTATIEVSTKQVEKVALGLQMGALSLSLRGLPEQSASLSDEVSASALQTFMRTGNTTQEDKRNYTMDIEVFTVNGKDLSLSHKKPPVTASKKHTITVLRGNSTDAG